MMKKHFIVSFTVIVQMLIAVLLSACSNNDINDTEQSVEDNGVGVSFTLDEEPYGNDDEFETRANDLLSKTDTMDIAEGIEAEVSIERDPAEKEALTRALKINNHYTIVAFEKGTGRQKGLLRGKFNLATGVFVPDAKTPSEISLQPGSFYDFVCYTDAYITRKGNSLNIQQKFAGNALVCRLPNVKILAQRKQSIAFVMRRFGARVRTKLVAAWELPGGLKANIASVAKAIPGEINLDMVSWKTSGGGAGTAAPAAQNYVPTAVYKEGGKNFNAVISKDWAYFLMGTKPEQLTLQFANGVVYGKNLKAGGARRFKAGKGFLANGSYVIRVKLLPKYKYLFNDGKEGYLSDPGRKNFTPIAIVIGNRLAIALWNANGNMPCAWHTLFGFSNQYNDRAIVENSGSSEIDYTKAAKDPETGMEWTWKPFFYTHEVRNVTKANEKTKFPAFYYAAHFDSELISKHLPKGRGLANNLRGTRRWFLASVSPWTLVYTALSLKPITAFTWIGYWDEFLVNRAFTVAGGQILVKHETFWTSAECSEHANGYYNIVDRHHMWVSDGYISVGMVGSAGDGKDIKFLVRPFVKY